MSLRGRSPSTIVFVGLFAVSEYLHLGSEPLTKLVGENSQLLFVSKMATALAVWIFAIRLIPIAARAIVGLCDAVTALTDKLTGWLRVQLIYVLKKTIDYLSDESPRT